MTKRPSASSELLRLVERGIHLGFSRRCTLRSDPSVLIDDDRVGHTGDAEASSNVVMRISEYRERWRRMVAPVLLEEQSGSQFVGGQYEDELGLAAIVDGRY